MWKTPWKMLKHKVLTFKLITYCLRYHQLVKYYSKLLTFSTEFSTVSHDYPHSIVEFSRFQGFTWRGKIFFTLV